MKQLFLKDPLFGTFLTIFLAVSAVSGVTVAHGDGLFSADVYRQGTDREVLLFRKYNEFEKNGSTATIRHVYLNTAGTASVEEEVIKENGEFKGYNVAFYELGTGGTIRREGERIYFEYTADGETEKGSYRFQPDLVCGPCIPDFIRTNWGSLEAGEPVRFHLPVMEYQRTVPFRFKRTDDSPYARPGAVVLRMKIAGLILGLLIGSVDFVFDESTRRVLEVHGSSVLKVEEEGVWKNVKVDIYYTYEE